MNRICAILLPLLLLTACGGNADDEGPLEVSGAKSGVISAARSVRNYVLSRPSATLGIFSSSFLAQGTFTSVASAEEGIRVQMIMQNALKSGTRNEAFAVLQEIGIVLTVDIVDLMNRNEDRSKTLNTYVDSLQNAQTIGERKHQQLEAELEVQKEKKKATSKERRALKKLAEGAFDNREYGLAAETEEQLVEVEGKLAEISTKVGHTRDLVDRFEELLLVTAERLDAIQKNRKILISGLRLFKVPGIQDLGILQEGRKWKGRTTSLY